MNKQQLASTIWQSANQMRSKIEANEYKDYILGFMFYKYLSDREISFLKGEKYSDEDIKKVTADDEKLVKHISENNRNNQSYQMLISICYLVVKGLLQTNTDGTTKLMDFLDEQRMCRLYAKFILEYYKKHYPKLTVSASHIPWALDDGIGDMLPVMQSDIHFQKENTVLIIDAKYYTNTTQVQFDKHTLHSNNLYQIFTYVKNREYQFGDEENKVSGMLLYARTDALIQPDNVYQMHGNQISVKTLDLNKPFDEIAKQLDEIAAAHFDGIEKTIQRKNNDK